MASPSHVDRWVEAHGHQRVLDYHEGQYSSPYRSTVLFCDWLMAEGLLDESVACSLLDVGCGMGGNGYYIARRFPHLSYRGLEINTDFVRRGNALLRQKKVQNCRLQAGNLFAPPTDAFRRFDGVISFQVLSWLPTLEEGLRAMAGFRPKWIAGTSLFFEGNVSATIELKDYTIPVAGSDHSISYCNVYALKQTEECFARFGFPDFRFKRFDIDIDLPKGSHGGLGTYTELLADGRRLQISGPIILSWYFILAMAA